MKVTILVDNSALMDRYLGAEPGFSALVETGGTKILFDTGFSDLLLRNAWALGIDLLDLDWIVLSHGHMDHTGGLFHLLRLQTVARIERRPFRRPKIVAHPDAFLVRPKASIPDIGAWFSGERLGRHMELHLSREPLFLTDDLLFLGEIPRPPPQRDTGRRIVRPDGMEAVDRLLDDTALAWRGREGLVVITGCSHAGISRIVGRAQEMFHEERLLDVIGGLHLAGPSPELDEARGFFAHHPVRALHACHCTSLRAKLALADIAPVEETGSGLVLEYC